MKKIALYGMFSPAVRRMFREELPDRYEIVEFENGEDMEKLIDADFMINRSYPVNDAVFAHAPRLELVQKWGAGYDKIDVKTAGARGISVAVCLGGNSEPVAELAVLLMMAVYRNLLPLNRRLMEGEWARDQYIAKSFMLRGKTVGLLGLGSIGQKTGKILKRGFDAQIQYHDLLRLPEEKELTLGFQFVDLETLLRTSDIISLHIPLFESTRNMIDAAAFDKMKPSAVVINTSRGGVIDETALYDALKAGKIAGAGLDTLAVEPIAPSCPLLRLENVVLTPHCGGNTADNDINMVRCCVENILQYERDGRLAPPVLVNQEELKVLHR